MNRSRGSEPAGRGAEWFVPGFGPSGFRSIVGLLFLPYTGMVLSFVAAGSALARPIYWDRLLAIEVVYLSALGVGAHALDALGRRGAKPWGTLFTRRQLWILALASLAFAYGIAVYYMVRYVPFLWSMALAEGFFVFAYNLEWFHGRFHSDGWFAFSWGFLPVVAGYMMQSNTVSVAALIVAAAAAFFGLVEIKASRPYKVLKQRGGGLTDDERLLVGRFEAILKAISLGSILLGGGLLIGRILG
jgi:hypothetical protein